jgi:carbonic anhydrase
VINRGDDNNPLGERVYKFMSVIDIIREKQRLAILSPPNLAPQKHQPDMLYIGCIDARLDPITDIGIPKGKALIFRNIGALVSKDEHGRDTLDSEAAMSGGEIPQNVSIGAAVEFFLHHIPLEHGKVKHIVIAAHTDCGGLKACQHAAYGDQDHHLPLYLKCLEEVRTKVMDDANFNGWDNAQVLEALEKESVRQSMANLLSYPVVRNAIDQGKLELHGWIIDTTTQHISEMNLQTLGFASMSAKRGTSARTASTTDRHR